MIKQLLGKISRKIVSKMDKNKKSPLKEEKKNFGYKNKKDVCIAYIFVLYIFN